MSGTYWYSRITGDEKVSEPTVSPNLFYVPDCQLSATNLFSKNKETGERCNRLGIPVAVLSLKKESTLMLTFCGLAHYGIFLLLLNLTSYNGRR
jgi:hypothetical protein